MLACMMVVVVGSESWGAKKYGQLERARAPFLGLRLFTSPAFSHRPPVCRQSGSTRPALILNFDQMLSSLHQPMWRGHSMASQLPLIHSHSYYRYKYLRILPTLHSFRRQSFQPVENSRSRSSSITIVRRMVLYSISLCHFHRH